MLKHLAVIAALAAAGVIFWCVGRYATAWDIDRSVERQIFYRIGDTLTDPSGKYVWPVLVPLDLVVMLSLSGALAWASVTWGPPGLGGSAGYYLILPLAYLAFDLAEDSLLVMLIKGWMPVAAATNVLLRGLTAGKMAAVILAVIQTVIAGAAALLRSLSA